MNNNKRFIYIEDNPCDIIVVNNYAEKLGLEMHWLPWVSAIGRLPKHFLKKFDFVLIDCMGTSLVSPIDNQIEFKDIDAVATSASQGFMFENIPFVHKSDIKKFLKERYGIK